jgi:hypothetical protein
MIHLGYRFTITDYALFLLFRKCGRALKSHATRPTTRKTGVLISLLINLGIDNALSVLRF